MARRRFDDARLSIDLDAATVADVSRFFATYYAPNNAVLVLVGDLHKGVIHALQYAQTLSPSVKGVYVELDPDRTRRLEEKWIKWSMGVPLVVLSSPYRSLLQPFLEYLDHLLALGDNHMVTIVIPEFVTAHWWQHLLHNQTAFLIKGTLLFRKNVVVTDVPYHLR